MKTKAGANAKKILKPTTHRTGTPQIGQQESQNSLHTVEHNGYRVFEFGRYFVVRC